MFCHVCTFFRIVCTPFIVHLYLQQGATCSVFILAMLCELTDLADGYFARRSQVATSSFGKIFDPIADSIWHISILLAFAHQKTIPLWIPLMIFWRDSCMGIFRNLCAYKGKILGAHQHAKAKSALLGISILVFLFGSFLVDRQWLHGKTFYSTMTMVFSFLSCLSWYTFGRYLFTTKDLIKDALTSDDA